MLPHRDKNVTLPDSEIFKKTPWPQSVSELYRPSDRRLSARLVPTILRIEGATWSA
jgi:hypothetical protein